MWMLHSHLEGEQNTHRRKYRDNEWNRGRRKGHPEAAPSRVTSYMQPPNSVTLADAKKYLLSGARYGCLLRGSGRALLTQIRMIADDNNNAYTVRQSRKCSHSWGNTFDEIGIELSFKTLSRRWKGTNHPPVSAVNTAPRLSARLPRRSVCVYSLHCLSVPIQRLTAKLQMGLGECFGRIQRKIKGPKRIGTPQEDRQSQGQSVELGEHLGEHVGQETPKRTPK
ncbi:rCG65851 [Rattus norvegicus]|uniref:LRRGT00073 n=2 Tax=Rattus norvegicus TaxID=10116 RepID=A0A9K3Y8E6_RAT|nr:LRRGT00073 [Rattus norvegicus]EDL78424.1 rCG65851 [Rattus norvegicus]|eukprot:NP_001041429.1 uncharacterized protein LOC500948 [Rattus norvegicus]